MVLALTNVCVAALLIYNVWSGTRTADLLATASKPFVIPEPKITPPGPVNLASLQDQALFYSARHFYVLPPPSSAPVGPPKPDYKLVGTFVIPSKPTVALLSNSSGISRKVKAGDDLDGWTVQIVERGRVALQYQNDTFEIAAAGKLGSAGMQVVALTRTAQSTPTSSGTRLLGSSVPPTAVSHAAYTTPYTGSRLYRPPPPPK
jgi:hypothetical protein